PPKVPMSMYLYRAFCAVKTSGVANSTSKTNALVQADASVDAICPPLRSQRRAWASAVVCLSDWSQHETHCVVAEIEHDGSRLWQVAGVRCLYGRGTRLEAVDVVVAEVVRRGKSHDAALCDRDRGAPNRRPGAIDPAEGSDSAGDVGARRRRCGS